MLATQLECRGEQSIGAIEAAEILVQRTERVIHVRLHERIRLESRRLLGTAVQ